MLLLLLLPLSVLFKNLFGLLLNLPSVTDSMKLHTVFEAMNRDDNFIPKTRRQTKPFTAFF